MLNSPHYIHIPGIQDQTIHYQWDDWNVEAVDLPINKDLLGHLTAISHRAVMAFTVATAEWIVYRFGNLSNDPLPWQRIEAGWAQIVNFRYSFEQDIDFRIWNGPVRGPIGIAMRRIIYACQQAEDGFDPVWRAGRASNLAEHVILNRSAYQSWRDRIFIRLKALYPFDKMEKLGEVVAREALDPEFDFNIAQTERLINQFLSGLDYKSNPYLNTPAQMLDTGFIGTPYKFSIEQDRKARIEW